MHVSMIFSIACDLCLKRTFSFGISEMVELYDCAYWISLCACMCAHNHMLCLVHKKGLCFIFGKNLDLNRLISMIVEIIISSIGTH